MKQEQIILIPTFHTLELFKTNNIVSIQADLNYTELHLMDERKIISASSFGRVLQLLSQFGFYQCHKSYAINISQVVRYHRSGTVEMTNGNKIPVARRRKDDFISTLYSHFKNYPKDTISSSVPLPVD